MCRLLSRFPNRIFPLPRSLRTIHIFISKNSLNMSCESIGKIRLLRYIYLFFAIYKYLRNSWAVRVARQQAARHVISKLHLITVSFPAVRWRAGLGSAWLRASPASENSELSTEVRFLVKGDYNTSVQMYTTYWWHVTRYIHT